MEGNQANNVLNKLVHLSVKESAVEEEFEKDFGSRLRHTKGAYLIQEIGSRLHCPFTTYIPAMILFHKVKKNSQLNHRSCLTPVACLSLSIKLCDEDVSADDIVLVSYHVIQDVETIKNAERPDPPSDELQQMKKNLILAEYAICRIFSFQPECDMAHRFVYQFLDKLKSITKGMNSTMVSMATTVTKLLNTYYMCEGSVDYAPVEIACACLQFAYLHCGILSSDVKYHLKREIFAAPDRNKTNQIVDELVLVADMSTKLDYI